MGVYVSPRRQTITITRRGQKIIDDKVEQAAEIVKQIQRKLGKKKYEELLDTLALLTPNNSH